MKKLFITLITVLTTATVAMASTDYERPIAYEQLPAASKQFIKTHFPEAKVAFVTVEDEQWNPQYDVIFSDGIKLEFIASGEWDDVDCRFTRVPVAIIPAAVLAFVKERHPDSFVTEIDRNHYGYELNLNNHIDMHFAHNGQFLGYDD
jgi:hypothetical protein